MTTHATTQSITLYFKAGSSDKVYQASLERKGAGFIVNFAFGRRGSTMQAGTKTPSPVAYEAARKIYDKLVAEKTAKGYSPGEAGTPYQHTDQESRATGIFPQLLNSIDEAAACRLIADEAWAMQEKFDGKRILVRKAAAPASGSSGGEVTGINRKGLTIALPQPLADCVRSLPGGDLVLDGESIGDTYTAFDLLELGGTDLRPQPYRLRLKALIDLVRAVGAEGPVRLAKTVTERAGKQAFLAELRARKAEGAVFKRLDAHYTPGRPASGGAQVKLKFTATASCLVACINAGKRSVALELLEGRKRVPIGNVTIPANQPIPAQGDIAEIRYLYAFSGEGGSLYQPVYLGQRDDIAASACTMGQLKFRSQEAGGEEDGN
jgi:bifunctional non-homologous end joining protein LigD